MPPLLDGQQEAQTVAPGRVAWSRTRHLLATLLVAALALACLTLVALRAGPDAVDVQPTVWLQQITFSPFAALMYWVSWPGFSPQNLALPLVVASGFMVRGYRVEAL